VPGRIIASRPVLSQQLPVAPTPEVRLPAGSREVTLRFAGLSLSSPERVRFEHQLEGVDEDWQDAGSGRAVTYRYLQPGAYTFRVRAANSDGVWNEEGVAVGFMLTPFIWQTAWFRSSLVLAAAAVLAIGVRRETRRRMAVRLEHLERQRQLERERSRIAQDLHDDLGAGLTEIGLLGSLAQRASQPPERVQEHLQRITEKAREMVTSLDEIVWSVNPRQDELKSVSRYFSEYAQQFLSLSPIRCRLEVDETWPEARLGAEWRQNLLLAFKEALTNVVRHSQASEVRITLVARDGKLRVSVRDNGQGARGETTAGADGWANMRARLKRMQGDCVVTSTAAGTDVEFTLPLPGVEAGSNGAPPEPPN
jgi:signal transduction histidine kinase